MRVIAGELRGRLLRAPAGLTTRPTADRVREALFSVLGDLRGARVLDLYAGTGALGIEALSRGAVFAAFVESAPAALECLRGNLQKLSLVERSKVFPIRVERAATHIAHFGPYDLVLCDPPWAQWDAALVSVNRLLVPPLLAVGATVVLEHPAEHPPVLELAGLVQSDRRRWGDTGVTILATPDAEEPP